ncbi:ubiquitin-related domain-containing protein [Rhizophagus clarus]|uniref:Ubiquitin-related domain-containing protein n=1 Tax=Rhizophagus clarus TaxID=94130 RepID=A0A8H3KVZ0_9GLOM|nr:ubiquitin-related domain-containing protein [Rhizophagus clarus]
MAQLSLFASAISAMIKSPVKTYDECVANGMTIKPSQILDLDTIYKKTLNRIESKDIVPPKNIFSNSVIQIQIFVKPISGDSKSTFVDPNITVLEFKDIIYAKFGFDIKTMRLIFNGKQLIDDKTLSSYNIEKGSTIQVLSKVVGGCDFFVIREDLLDPQYDYDFTNLRDNGTTFIRGMELYKRPYGWERIAVNVSRYGHDRTWLGSVGDSPHEWPVSYHGTRREFIESIINEGYLVSRGVNFAFGRGIYSSPYIEIAEQYAPEFENNNIRYKAVFQNRVNPEGLTRYCAVAAINTEE